jgi:hypothetical protein
LTLERNQAPVPKPLLNQMPKTLMLNQQPMLLRMVLMEQLMLLKMRLLEKPKNEILIKDITSDNICLSL